MPTIVVKLTSQGGKIMLRKLGVAGVIAVVMSLVVAGVVLALTITVDGDILDWTPSGGGPNDALVHSDAHEADIPDLWNISDLFFTNNSSTIFFRWDTFDNTDYLGTFQLLCIDIDPNASPVTGGSIAQCNGQAGVPMTGVDYIVRIVDGGPNNGGSMQLRRCATGVLLWQSCTIVSGSVLQFAFATSHSELSVRLQDIGYVSPFTGCPNGQGSQPCTTHIGLYFDNGATPPDDNVPDTGDIVVLIGCGGPGNCSPTAITLNSLQAQPTTSPIVPVALVGVSALALIGVVFVARRRKTA
jgi:hypothetical protein